MIEDAFNELVQLKDSWNRRGLPAGDAFIALASMLARFALANNSPIEITCSRINRIIQVLYDDLSRECIN